MFKRNIYQDLRNIYQNGVAAVIPEKLIAQNVFVENQNTIMICDKSYNTANGCYVVGFGKAVLGMAVTLERILGYKLVSGVISVPVGILSTIKVKPNYKPVEHTRIDILEGAENNLPDQLAENNAKEIINFINQTNSDGLLIVLISGGGSALLPVPKPPLKLFEKVAVIKHMTSLGADIKELNTVRKQLSLVKGGGLAEIACPRKVVTLIISDVIGNRLDLIASGPTVRNQDTFDDVREVFEKYDIRSHIQETVFKDIFSTNNNHIRDEEQEVEDYDCVDNYIIGSNVIALKKACNLANSLGYAGCVVSHTVNGTVEAVSWQYMELTKLIMEFIQRETLGKDEFYSKLTEVDTCLNMTEETINILFHAIFKFKKEAVKGICLLMGGETTVIVEGNGLGGRNQQLALQFSVDMGRNMPDPESPSAILLCAGTDGIDGPTKAAGAIGFGEQFQKAADNGLDPISYIQNNDSNTYYTKLKKGKYLIKIGHTGTNVMDLHILGIAHCNTK